MRREWSGSAEMEALFDRGAVEADGRAGDAMAVKTRWIKAGPQMEVEIYPIWDTRIQRAAQARARDEKHRQAVAAVNERRRREGIRRLILCNFEPGDLFVTLTYREEAQEGIHCLADVRADVRAYLRRVKRWRKRKGLEDLKYLYVIEKQTKKLTQAEVYHAHVFMGRMERDAAEEMWPHGFVNTKKLQDAEGERFERISRYVCKGLGSWREYERAWGHSRNLKEPEVRESSKKISRTKLRRALAQIEADPGNTGLRALAEREFPTHDVVRVEARGSRYVPGVYVKIRMRERRKVEWPSITG